MFLLTSQLFLVAFAISLPPISCYLNWTNQLNYIQQYHIQQNNKKKKKNLKLIFRERKNIFINRKKNLNDTLLYCYYK